MKNLIKTSKKIVRDESLEILKTAKQQISPEKINPESEKRIEEIQKTAEEKDITPEEVLRLEQQKNRQLSALDAEIDDIRRQRQQKEKQWEQQQGELMSEPDTQEEPTEEPTSKQRRGAKKAKGSKARVEKVKFRRERAKGPSG